MSQHNGCPPIPHFALSQVVVPDSFLLEWPLDQFGGLKSDRLCYRGDPARKRWAAAAAARPPTRYHITVITCVACVRLVGLRPKPSGPGSTTAPMPASMAS